MNKFSGVLLIMTCITLFSCSKTSGPLAIFKKLSPHDQYGQRLKDAGLHNTAMGSAWLRNGDASLNAITTIELPYRETGYLDAVKNQAVAMRFTVKRGQKLKIGFTKKPAANFMIFADLLQERAGDVPKLLASADTTTDRLEYDIDENGKYILRLQPELLRSGEYTLVITTGPSLSFPVSASGKPKAESFWGADRDAGSRRHEGVDIFAPKGTPAIASAAGTVTSVSENKLGGLVVFMRPADKDYALYYAHLSKQIAANGQNVNVGDTLGLVGNTGNAAGGPTHLHFGIYTSGGAIDPYPFIDREIKQPKPVTANTALLNETLQVKSKTAKLYTEPDERGLSTATLNQNNIVNAQAATTGWYRVALADGQNGYLQASNVREATPLRKNTLKIATNVYESPDSTNSPRKKQLNAGDKVDVLGSYQNYQLVKAGDVVGWVVTSQSN